MSDWELFPAPAKLNLFLHVVGRRNDGYHLLQTAFRFIDRQDDVFIRVRDDGVLRRVNELPGVPAQEDLSLRAARLLQADSGCPLGAELRIVKRLPLGGGLGGGSSDAASSAASRTCGSRSLKTPAFASSLADRSSLGNDRIAARRTAADGCFNAATTAERASAFEATAFRPASVQIA